MERRKRRKRIRRLRMAIKITIYALMVLLIGGVVWAVVSRFIKNDDTLPTESDTVTKTGVIGSGDALRTAYTGTGGRMGWNVDETGWWYLNDDETIFTSGWQTIDGNQYYFNENGYMATGWNQVDGEYHYFRIDGIEEPEATEKLVAVTFDDGPSSHTDRLLTCLENNGAKATFFVVGEQVEQYPDALKRAESLGMEIGSHTYDHPYISQLDADGVVETMAKNDEVITSVLGHGTTIMRPTGGAVNDIIRSNVNRPMINWDLDTKDWKSKDVDSIVNLVLEHVQDGSVILLHDLYETTVEASEIFIPELVSRGYRMVTVSELAGLRGVELEVGEVYENFYVPEAEGEDAPESEDTTAEEGTAE